MSDSTSHLTGPAPSFSAPEKESLLAAIIAGSEKAIISEDTQGIITTWNHRAEVMFGYSADEVVGQSATAFTPASQLQDDAEERSRALSGAPVRQYETLRLCKDGRTIGISVLLSPIKAADGTVIGLCQIASESADWQKSPDKMQLLAAIVKYSENSIISVDINGFITSWNRGAEQIFGFTSDEAVGRNIDFFVPPELRQKELEILAKIREGKSVFRHETSRLRKDGTRAYGVVTISPIYDPQGKIIGASRVALDITERKKAEEKLQLLVGALEAAANGIVITDVHGRIEWANDAFTRLTGYSLDEVKGKTPSLLKSGRHDPAFYACMWKTVLEGKFWRGEMTNKRKNGSIYCEDMTITPMRNPAGKLTHFIAVKQDISERIHAADERDRLIAELREALGHVQTLSGLLPICASCKKVRDDSGYWSQVEVYIQKHSNASFTHGICPDCAEKMLRELDSP